MYQISEWAFDNRFDVHDVIAPILTGEESNPQSGLTTIRSKERSVTSPHAATHCTNGFGTSANAGYEAKLFAVAPIH